MQACRTVVGRVLSSAAPTPRLPACSRIRVLCATVGTRVGNPGTTVAPLCGAHVGPLHVAHAVTTTEYRSFSTFGGASGGSDSDSDCWPAGESRTYTRDQFGHFKDHALKILSARPHGEGELRQKLHVACLRRQRRKKRSAARGRVSNDYGDVDCGALARDVVEFLVNDNWLSDERFAAFHVEQREAFRPRSRMVLLSELASKRVPSSIAQAAVEEYDEDEACRRLADRKRLWSRSVIDRRKYLARQAFPYDVIARVEEEHALLNPPADASDE